MSVMSERVWYFAPFNSSLPLREDSSFTLDSTEATRIPADERAQRTFSIRLAEASRKD